MPVQEPSLEGQCFIQRCGWGGGHLAIVTEAILMIILFITKIRPYLLSIISLSNHLSQYVLWN